MENLTLLNTVFKISSFTYCIFQPDLNYLTKVRSRENDLTTAPTPHPPPSLPPSLSPSPSPTTPPLPPCLLGHRQAHAVYYFFLSRVAKLSDPPSPAIYAMK